ncbi:MAG: PfkB family carbohydrate kinase [Acidimicrobiia bacterium]|nr:PfkB family carbohydrate kinase [Acidimicrobiia bacterium]
MPHVTCVGIAVLDLVFRVDTHPTEPGKYRAATRREVGGGVAANASVTVTALGGEAAFIGCVGDDPTGDRIVAGLEARGVDVAAVRRVVGAASPLSAVLVDAAGERLIVNHASPELFDEGHPVEPHELAGTDAVLTDMRWPDGAVPALVAARAAGIPAIVDCDHNPSVNRGAAILAAATHVIFSLPTLTAFTGAADAEEAIRRASEHTDAWVATTAGDDGVYWLDGGAVRHRPASAVDVVDTLGAGDVFHGAFALAIVEGRSVEQAVRFASAAAALKCTRPGGRAGIPGRPDVDAFLAERDR